jgi:hypothetical protein
MRLQNNFAFRFFSKLCGIATVAIAFLTVSPIQAATTDISSLLDSCNVAWDVPGPTSSQSMPIGNGDIGLNVWVETNGDLLFYIGKSDAWNQDVIGDQGLMKAGGVRVSLNPSPLTEGAKFLQTLKLRTGEIEVQEGSSTLRVWVDANNPVIRVEASHAEPRSMTVSLNNWRPPSARDVTLTNQTNRIAWYHRNAANANPHVANLTFGGVIQGSGLAGSNESTLVSAKAGKSQLVSIYALTAATPTPEEWLAQLDAKIAKVEKLKLEKTRTAHQKWWDDFWHRSWVFVDGDNDAANATRGYVLQRFVTACAGRGAYPIKFNGSIFIVDSPAQQLPNGRRSNPMSPDQRTWGGQYWFQNTRAMYWPRLAAGDFDMMLPLFKMYAGQLAPNAAQVMGYYHHEGAYFAETAPFWGGLRYWGPEVKEDWTGHYFTPILELSMMMLDYYEYTGDKKFAKETLLPVASAGLTFFDQHFPRDSRGKILLDPDNSIEMYWKVHNPAPDIGGLQSVLDRMIALPHDLVSDTQRTNWQRMMKELPGLPTDINRGKKILLPYTGPQTARFRNGENPELYAIYPFRLYGLGMPDLDLAVDTFKARKMTQMGCWVQDPIQSAMLGLADVAKKYTLFALTRKEPGLKFPAFWAKANDYAPDEDNGGNGENGLQQMLVQSVGQKILVMPAWPTGWNAEFKLNAAFQTTVQGTVKNGKLSSLIVTPHSRQADVVDMSAVQNPATVVAKASPAKTVENSTEPLPVVQRPVAQQPAAATTGNNGAGVESILAPTDTILPLKQTAKGKGSTLAVSGDFGGDGDVELVESVIDGSLDTKYFNKGTDGEGKIPGIDSGFLVTPKAGAKVITAIQFATANDSEERDPVNITLEGSDADDAAKAPGSDFTLIYSGPSGLSGVLDRNHWGQVIAFTNAHAYKSYRVLITAVRGEANGTQYSEVKLGTALQK